MSTNTNKQDATCFALVDVNNFYVSCERIFNSRLLGRPVIVLANNDGVTIARSHEADATSARSFPHGCRQSRFKSYARST